MPASSRSDGEKGGNVTTWRPQLLQLPSSEVLFGYSSGRYTGNKGGIPLLCEISQETYLDYVLDLS